MTQGKQILGPLITARIKRMARDRLVHGLNFFTKSNVGKFTRIEIKLALLLVKDVNPHEFLTNQEEAVLRGVSRDKLRGHKDRKELPRVP